MDKIKVLELFAGTKSIGKAAKELGYEVFSTDYEPKFNTDYTIDLLNFEQYDKSLKKFIEPHYEIYFTSDFLQLYNINNDEYDVTSKMLHILNEIGHLLYLANILRTYKTSL